MRELLEQSVADGDEVFAEAEDDVEFEHRDGACLLTDEQDIVDSDFDENSSEDGS